MAEKTVHIRYFAPIDDTNTKKLFEVIDKQLNEGASKFVLMMSSGGGSVFHGLSAYNYLKGIPAEVVTHNFGSVISMAVVMFCAGSRRLSVPHATFLLHGVQSNFPQNTSLEEKQLEERLKAIRMDIENIAGVIAATVGKKEEEVFQAMVDRTTLNPEQSLDYGLIHEITEQLYEGGAELISIQ